MKKALLIISGFFVLNLTAYSIEKSPDISIEDLSGYFANYTGCLVLYDETKDKYGIYNERVSRIQASPDSTYKIIHSLIGLETKVLEDENTVFKWDGTIHTIPEWNQDQTLKTAIKYSTVWYFRKVAVQVGKDKERYFLDKSNYGNADLSGNIKDFWLQSSLKISPMEQIDFLKKFHHYRLPFSKRNIDIVKNVIVLSNNNNGILSGKTGAGLINDKTVNGWFIGYVEKGNNIYYFASYIQGEDGWGWKAEEITLKILKDKNIW